jgi:hypothetical protein
LKAALCCTCVVPGSGSFVFNDSLRYAAKKRDKMLVLITLITDDSIRRQACDLRCRQHSVVRVQVRRRWHWYPEQQTLLKRPFRTLFGSLMRIVLLATSTRQAARPWPTSHHVPTTPSIPVNTESSSSRTFKRETCSYQFVL